MFDTTDVTVQNPQYALQKVEWSFDGGHTFEKEGGRVDYEIINESRHTVIVRYSFFSQAKKITSVIQEKIMIELKKQDIAAILHVTQDSDYVPVTVHMDGSASQAKEGTIVKFIYDF